MLIYATQLGAQTYNCSVFGKREYLYDEECHMRYVSVDNQQIIKMSLEAEVKRYKENADKVILLSERNEFLSRLSKVNLQSYKPNPYAVVKQNESSIQFENSISKLIEIETKLHQSQNSLNSNDLDEVSRLELILKELESKEAECQAALAERLQFKASLEQIDDTFKVKNAPPISSLELVRIIQLRERAAALLDGIKSLSNIQNISAKINENSELVLQLVYEGLDGVHDNEVEAEFIVSHSGQLTSVQINSDLVTRETAAVILKDAQCFDTPQNLRYAVFAVKSAVQYEHYVHKHTMELKSVCEVEEIEPYKLSIALGKGITMLVQLHYSYPNIPGGMKVVNLSHCNTGLSDHSLADAKEAVNNQCFSNVLDMLVYVNNKL